MVLSKKIAIFISMRKIVFVLIFMIAWASNASAQEHYHKLDYYLYLFAKNIQWPDSLETDNFVIGVLGETDANSHLFDLAEHQEIRGLKIKVKEFQSPSDIDFCHLLFIPDALSDKIPQAMKLMSLNTLLITETPGQAVLGSGINIEWMKHYEKIHYEINKAAFRKAGLKINPELLASSAYK